MFSKLNMNRENLIVNMKTIKKMSGHVIRVNAIKV